MMKKIIQSIVVLLSVVSFSASAQLRFAEGKDYTILEAPLLLQKAGQKEIVEFFSYACPHCYHLNKPLHDWLVDNKPQDVGFYQIPATGGKLWSFTAQVKYTADKLGLGYDFDERYFSELHEKNNRRLMGSESTVFDLMTEFGADKKSAEKAWDSLQVKSKLKQSVELWRQSGLSGVPAVIVNGRYVVELTTYERFFSVIDFLLSTTEVK